MPYSLRGRKVLVTGGSRGLVFFFSILEYKTNRFAKVYDRGLGELICLKFAEQGCDIVINYNTSVDRAKGVLERIEKDYGTRTFVLKGDMGLEADCVTLVKESIEKLGGLDIIISNAGYTRFSEFGDLHDTTTEDWDVCYSVNVKAQHLLMREALATFNSNPEGGVFIITSSVAGRITGGSSLPYSVTKAAQLHLMRCLASTQGPKIRVNAVLPGYLPTEWGGRYSPEKIKDMKERSYLKKDTDLDDTAQAFIDIAKNTSMTGQRIQIDSGLGQND